MKHKIIPIFVAFSVIMSLFGVGIVNTSEVKAQAPTTEATAEPTAEPTEVVPVEVSPTAPEAELTVAPTEEATAEPTANPADVEATATTEATAEPTETAEPTATPVEEVVEPVGVIEAAIAAIRAVTSFQVQNIGGNQATVNTTYNTETGAAALVAPAVTIPINGNINVYQPSVAGLVDGFKGSATLASDALIGSIGNIVKNWDNLKSGSASYSGFSSNEIGNIFYAPTILKNFGNGYSTEITIQNTTATAASVEIRYYSATDGSEITAAKQTVSIPASGSTTVSQLSNANLPTSFQGGAVISAGTSDKLAIVITNYNNEGRLTAYNGFADGSTAAYAPTIDRFYGASKFTTSYQVMAIEDGATAVSVSYRNPDGTQKGSPVSFTLNKFQSYNRYQGSADDAFLGDSFIGNIVVTADKKVVLIANNVSTLAGTIDSVSYNGFATGATKFVLPSLSKKFGGGGYISSLQVMNVSNETANVQVTLIKSDGTTVGSALPYTVNTNGSISEFLGSATFASVPDGAVYGAIIESTNGKNIVAIGNAKGYAVNGDGSTSYNGVKVQ